MVWPSPIGRVVVQVGEFAHGMGNEFVARHHTHSLHPFSSSAAMPV